jgi:cell shape-determining protein MreC
MTWSDIIQTTLVSGGVLYLLVDRFVRTREQRGSDAAQMIKQVAEAFEKTLGTVTTYSQDVIEKMREDRRSEDKRHEQTERRCSQLEKRLEELAAENELLKAIFNQAFGCKFIKTGNNKDCPVLTENQKRMKARCKAACKPEEKELE